MAWEAHNNDTTPCWSRLHATRQTTAVHAARFDEPLAMAHNGSVYYFSVDGLGSVVLLTTPSGAVQNASLYDAWGERRHQSGSLPQPFAYTAREPAEAGLWFYRARYYQPGIGRFGSEDPLGFPRSVDRLYLYASGNPALFRDPLGLFSMGWGCDKCPERWNPLADATTKKCADGLGMITDPALRRCIDRSCKVGKIVCKHDCGVGGLGASDHTWGQIASLFGGASRVAIICVNRWPDVERAGAGDDVIHEWAHGCGWSHGQGRGVPGNNGTFP